MNSLNYLISVEKLDCMIRQKEERIEELKNEAEGIKAIQYDADKVQTSVKDRMSEIIAEYGDMINELNEDKLHLQKKKSDVIDKINLLDNTDQIRVLVMNYVNLYNLKQIADKMNRSERQIFRIRKEALKNFDRIYMMSVDVSNKV